MPYNGQMVFPGGWAVPTTAFSKEFLDAQKGRLLRHKERIMGGMRTVREDIRSVPEDSMESGDVASAHISQGLSIGLHSKSLGLLREVDEALERLRRGTYGLCEETGEPIGRKRLESVPWTRVSLETAEGQEEDRRADVLELKAA